MLGGCVALFNASMSLFGKSQVRDYQGAIAGAVGGLAMAMGPADREFKKTLALFFFIRAAESQVKIAVDRKWLPQVPHADVLILAVASAQTFWGWIFEPAANDPTYQFFLNRMNSSTGKPRVVIESLRKMVSDEHCGLSPDSEVSADVG